MIDAIFVGGPLDGQRRVLNEYGPSYETLSNPFSPLTHYRREYYRPERIHTGHDFILYVHESMCLPEAIERIFEWYGRRAATEQSHDQRVSRFREEADYFAHLMRQPRQSEPQ